jgi:outer membrane protein TolC
MASTKNINDADPMFSLFTRSYNTSFSVSIVQDLLRDSGVLVNEAETFYARLGESRAHMQAEQVAANITYSVIEAYWNLVLAREQLAIREKTLEIAISLLADNERKLAVGLTAQPEVIQAKSTRAQEEDRVLLARTEVLRAEDVLRVLIAGGIARTDSDDLSVWKTRLVPGAERLPDQIPLADEDQFYVLALGEAMQSRPDVKIANLSLEEAKRRLDVALNKREHNLELAISTDTSGRDATLGRSIHETFSDKFFTWRVGIAYSVPLGNSSAEAGYQQSQRSVDRAKEELAIMKIAAFREIRDAYRSYQTATQRIQTTRASVEYSDLVWRNEQEKMRLGLTTTFQVSQTARDLAEAETARKQAEIDRILAFYRLQQARGKLTAWNPEIAGN